MEQAPDKSKSPPSTSYRETYRRHRKLFFVPVVLGALAAGFIAFTSGGSYTSTASLWIDTAAPLASSVGASLSPPLTEPPAASEQGILTELLTTQAFATSVAKSSLLGKQLGSDAAIEKYAPEYVEAKQVGSLVTGAQVLKITYTGKTAAMAQSVLGGIVTQLRKYNDGLSAQHDQAAVTYDKEQVTAAEAALQTARTNVNTYMAAHPNAAQSDPNLQSLTTAETNASTAVGQANTALAQATSPASRVPWTIEVVDAPGPAISAALGKKKLLELILAGAFAGLLASFLAVVALTPAKKEAWEDELPVGTPFARDVPPAVPGVRSALPDVRPAVPDVPPADPLPFPMESSPLRTGAGKERTRLAARGRVFVRSQSEHVDD